MRRGLAADLNRLTVAVVVPYTSKPAIHGASMKEKAGNLTDIENDRTEV